jgi:hypothetical protein
MQIRICSMPGCQTSAGCRCNQSLGLITFVPHGCVCPPGSEKTCQGLTCPRRAPIVDPALSMVTFHRIT